MQGREAASDVPTALRRLRRVDPDLVVLVRGGGARGDLAAFESEGVARAIASAPFPVWTGIGHTGDHSVADAVANRSLVTPTACGEAVVDRVATFWAGVARRAHHLATRTRQQLDAAAVQLRASSLRAGQALAHQLERRSDGLAVAAASARRGAMLAAERSQATLSGRAATLASAQRHLLDAEIGHVRSRRDLLRAYDPRRQLERGYATVRDERGVVVRRAGELRSGSRISTAFLDGSASSVVESVEIRPESNEPDAVEREEADL
jgi:exodeoxyribonuclease VII large subunit